jgi:hypothetical protein
MEGEAMKDLKICYNNENGDLIRAEYDTIMDFTDAMESDDVDIPMMDYENVEADFFENPLLHQHFKTIADLYLHCKMIVR